MPFYIYIVATYASAPPPSFARSFLQTFEKVEEAFTESIAAMVLGDTTTAVVAPIPTILYTRQSGLDVQVVLYVTLFPTADLLSGFRLRQALTDKSKISYYIGAGNDSPTFTEKSTVSGPTIDCRPAAAGDVQEVEKVIDWSVVGTIFAVLGLVILGSALVCVASGCGRVVQEQRLPAVATPHTQAQESDTYVVATARTKYVRELIAPSGPTDTIVDLGMGLNSNTTLHTHL